jgi:hypothetical protein
MSELTQAIAELQANPPKITKRATGQVGTRAYKYATLDAVWAATGPWRERHGIVWICCPTREPTTGLPALSYQLEHVKTGDTLGGMYPLTDAHGQALGADITYARRYAYCAVLGLLADEDTDGRLLEPRTRTRAKTTGPYHERLRNGTVEPTPEDRPATRTRTRDEQTADPWTDQPAGHFEEYAPETKPGTIDRAQERKMFALFKGRGITDEAVIHGMIANWLGREQVSIKALSRLDAELVIAHLQGKVRTDA